MAQTLAFAPPADGREFHMTFACRVARAGILCFGPLDRPILRDDRVLVNGAEASAARLSAVIQEGGARHTLLILNFPDAEPPEYLDALQIRRDHHPFTWKADRIVALYGSEAGLAEFMLRFSEDTRRKLFFLLARLAAVHPAAAADPVYTRALAAARNRLGSADLTASDAFWASPRLLCLELPAPPRRWADPRLVITTASGAYAAPLYPCSPGSGGKHLLCAWFGRDIRALLHGAQYAILDGARAFPLDTGPMEGAAAPAALLHCLSRYEAGERQMLREAIAQALLPRAAADDSRKEAQDLLFNLQRLVQTPHGSITGAADPIGMNVEHAFPAGADKLFVQGWLRDPRRQIARVEAIADLGFSFPIGAYMRAFPRGDAQEIYAAQGMPDPEGITGFTALSEVPESFRRRCGDFAAPISYRFRVVLKSGVEYCVSPRCPELSAGERRDLLLREVAPMIVGHEAAEIAVSGALHALQRESARNPEIARTRCFGAQPDYPALSLVIPVYGCLEFIRAQIAHFASDPFLAACEVLYVLDDPARENAFRELLQSAHDLYGLPLKMLALERNYGYAAASGLGAREARGTHLLLLNSDVLPRRRGWLEAMWYYHARRENIGALGPTLLFPGGGVQHAGMYIAPGPSVRHFGKGRSVEWLEGAQPRAVPAVTGACMLIEKALFAETGGFDGHFLFGDFEDAHLCLKLAERGRENIYLPEAVLYHMERQSVPLAEGYRDNAAFPLNSRLFRQRWEHRLSAELAA